MIKNNKYLKSESIKGRFSVFAVLLSLLLFVDGKSMDEFVA